MRRGSGHTRTHGPGTVTPAAILSTATLVVCLVATWLWMDTRAAADGVRRAEEDEAMRLGGCVKELPMAAAATDRAYWATRRRTCHAADVCWFRCINEGMGTDIAAGCDHLCGWGPDRRDEPGP